MDDVRHIGQNLEELGLTSAEALAYVTLVRHGSLGAPAVAERSGVPRASAYPALRALAEKGLVEAGAGYRSRFRAVPPEQALPNLIEQDREALHERERVAKELTGKLVQLSESREEGPEEVVEVIRSLRAISDRFDRLQLEAEREILMAVKPPIVWNRQGNPSEERALGRGVRVRVLYERGVLEDDAVGPHLRTWIEAGEEARLSKGELPLKMTLFDGEAALLPLPTPHEPVPVTAVLIRHQDLCKALRRAFDADWEEAEPLT